MLNFVMFVHTYLYFGVIINIVKTPNTLYSFFATPHKKKRKIPSPKSTAVAAVLFTFYWRFLQRREKESINTLILLNIKEAAE